MGAENAPSVAATTNTTSPGLKGALAPEAVAERAGGQEQAGRSRARKYQTTLASGVTPARATSAPEVEEEEEQE